MRIVQIIDSLAIGGAEKMAVNYANLLSNKIEFSGIVATRKEGKLKEKINNKVHYLFLERKNILDFISILRLTKYCKTNKIEYLQAHSSSFFTAFLVKICLPKIKIIWHDHNGLSEFLSSRKTLALKIASYFFDGIIVVNDQLKRWAESKLNCEKVIYLPNFTSIIDNQKSETKLFGKPKQQILCLANLRFQKNHELLIQVALLLKKSHPDWTFHLVGKDFNDNYSNNLKQNIITFSLHENVYIYGSKMDTNYIISQSEICILTSQSEGLPISLLEYGLHKKPVVVTNVGEIPLIIQNGINGFICPNKDSNVFFEKLSELISSSELRNNFGQNLYETIIKNNSEEGVITKFLNWLQ
ncbi:MAG: glycosyltransferase family 4 protein [Flavobacterium sp.]|nr:glycosyltransferase family 4 protein [Flavobacterium sp.]